MQLAPYRRAALEPRVQTVEARARHAVRSTAARVAGVHRDVFAAGVRG